jgi:hypothetical protein
MLVVYGPDGTVLFQEHLERTRSGPNWAGTLSVGVQNGSDVIVVDHGVVRTWTCSE